MWRTIREKVKQIAKLMGKDAINIINKEVNGGKFSQINMHKNLK